VSKYFAAWANILRRNKELKVSDDLLIAFIDLSNGPSEAAKAPWPGPPPEAPPSPMLILGAVLKDPDLADHALVILNDPSEGRAAALANEIKNHEGLKSLRFEPIVQSFGLGRDIVEYVKNGGLPPTFLFLDPWGYEDLAIDFLTSALRAWRADCLFLFDYDRVIASINDDSLKSRMASIFGEEELDYVKGSTEQCDRDGHEIIVMDSLIKALRYNNQFKYILPFRFINTNGIISKYHLIFITKYFKSYDLMKYIIDEKKPEGQGQLPSFEYNSPDPRHKTGSAFESLSMPMDELGGLLATEFAGKRISFKDLYKQHSVGRPFTRRHYRLALGDLLKGRQLAAYAPTGERRLKKTIKDAIIVEFVDAL
jgi:three-Cys-motif partner protein